MNVVLDTNVLISFLLTRGETISRILKAWEDEEYVLCVSPQIITELGRVLGYPHLKNRIKSDEAQALVDQLQADGYWVEGLISAAGATSDPKDDMIIACAIEAKADYIVSGDPDLLKIGNYRDIRILSPAEFLGMLKPVESEK